MRSSAVRTCQLNLTTYGCNKMIEILNHIDELLELQKLYNEGELRNIDFESKIQKLLRKVEEYEIDMQGGMYA